MSYRDQSMGRGRGYSKSSHGEQEPGKPRLSSQRPEPYPRRPGFAAERRPDAYPQVRSCDWCYAVLHFFFSKNISCNFFFFY